MFETIIETIAGALGERFAGKAAEKGLQKAGKARGWISLLALVLLIAGLIWFGVYLIHSGVWPVGALMLAIALFIAYITAMAARRNRRRRQPPGAKPSPTTKKMGS